MRVQTSATDIPCAANIFAKYSDKIIRMSDFDKEVVSLKKLSITCIMKEYEFKINSPTEWFTLTFTLAFLTSTFTLAHEN